MHSNPMQSNKINQSNQFKRINQPMNTSVYVFFRQRENSQKKQTNKKTTQSQRLVIWLHRSYMPLVISQFAMGNGQFIDDLCSFTLI